MFQNSDPSTTEEPTEDTQQRSTRTTTPTPRSPIVERYGDRFDTIVNVVEAGADDTGQEAINDVISSRIDDDTLLYFPSGEYSLEPFRTGNVRNLGLVSLPGENVDIVPAVPGDQFGEFISLQGVSELLLEGIDFDFTDPEYGGEMRVVATGDFVARDLRIRGKLPDQNLKEKHVGFRFDVTDDGSNGVVERVVAKDGGHDGGNGVGIFVGKDHAGTLLFRDCEIANFPNNGLYASAPGRDSPGYQGQNGAVHVRGGRYMNNNIANVRIGSTGSTIRNVSVIVDEVPPSPADAGLNVRGIRLRARSEQLVENCDIMVGEQAGIGFGAISYHPDHGSSTIRNTNISVHRDDYTAIDATDASNGGTRAPLTFESVAITGSASGGSAVEIADRGGTEFRNCTIEQPGADRDGIVLRGSDGCRVVDSAIRVTGTPIEAINSTVERVNLTVEQLPSDDSGSTSDIE